MSMATRTDTHSPALHVADSHDLIRVHGACENNLKALSVEIPKRRLTVFTGVNPSPPGVLCGPQLGSIIGPGLVGVVVVLCRLRARRRLWWGFDGQYPFDHSGYEPPGVCVGLALGL
jgi:hypothetical protein